MIRRAWVLRMPLPAWALGAFCWLLICGLVGAQESGASPKWQAGPASSQSTSIPAESQGAESPGAASEAAAPGEAVAAVGEKGAFRDLVQQPPKGSRYSVLPPETASTATLDWRKALEDSVKGSPYERATLQLVIDLAEANNYSLKNSERSVLKSKSQYFAAKSDFIPFANLVGETLYEDSRANAGPTLARTTTVTRSAGVDLTQNIPTGGKLTVSEDVIRQRTHSHMRDGFSDTQVRDYTGSVNAELTQPLLRGGGFDVGLAPVRQGRLNEMSAELSDSVNRRNVAMDVITSFYNIISTLSVTEVRLAALDVRKRLITDTELLVELGMKIPSEIAKARVAYLREEANTVQLRDTYKNQIEDLLDAVGLALTTPISFREPTGEVLDAKLAGVPERDAAVHEAMANRPEMMLADINIRSAEITLELAKNDTLPNLDFSAGYADREVGPDLDAAMDQDDRRTWNAGLQVVVPLQNIRRIETKKRAGWDLETAKTNRTITERSVVGEIDTLLRQLSTAEDTIKILREQVQQAEFTLQQETELLKWGERTVNQVQEAQDNFFNAQVDYNQQLMDYQTLIARVYRALGRPLY
ncbi:MAG: TolC family protein [Candidatus Sumerlaeota bacterium]|nr:TolC family protein [Candidatus Sumerlaeota bacterium]